MSFSAARVAEHGGEVEDARGMPAEVSWEMLDMSRFFVLGAALFSGVSAALYPAVVLKTHLQVAAPPQAAAAAILRRDGPRGFYRGFGASLAGTVPARALYMAALEATKSAVGSAALRLGVAEPAAGGVSAAVAAQVVWTPVDVVSQRLMVQTAARYRGGADAFRKILLADGRRARPVPRLRCLGADVRALQRRVVGLLRDGEAAPLARRRPRAPRQPRRRDGRAGRERRRGGERGRAGDDAAGHREDAAAGAGHGRWGAETDDRAAVGVYVAVFGHHGHHLRVLEAALGQGRLLLSYLIQSVSMEVICWVCLSMATMTKTIIVK